MVVSAVLDDHVSDEEARRTVRDILGPDYVVTEGIVDEPAA
jgi:hypothetical protein